MEIEAGKIFRQKLRFIFKNLAKKSQNFAIFKTLVYNTVNFATFAFCGTGSSLCSYTPLFWSSQHINNNTLFVITQRCWSVTVSQALCKLIAYDVHAFEDPATYPVTSFGRVLYTYTWPLWVTGIHTYTCIHHTLFWNRRFCVFADPYGWHNYFSAQMRPIVFGVWRSYARDRQLADRGNRRELLTCLTLNNTMY